MTPRTPLVRPRPRPRPRRLPPRVPCFQWQEQSNWDAAGFPIDCSVVSLYKSRDPSEED